MNETKTTKIIVDNAGQQNTRDFWQQFDNMQEKINNLQSKIDKANEILDKLEMQPAYLDCKYYELGGFNELRNALKEDK